jgi:hypothetical protein
MSDNTEKKQGSRFTKGESGNPNGRPKGSLNSATLACQELLDGEAANLTRKAIDMALEGNILALKICLERIVPQKKERHISMTLPAIEKDADLPLFIGALIEAVTTGQITIIEAQSLQTLAMAHRQCLHFGQPDPFALPWNNG